MNCYEKSRRHMVDGQLKTNNIDSEAVLQAFGEVPRERFLPSALQGSAYVDEDIPLEGGDFLMEPLVLARMVQAGRPGPGDKVLNVGDCTGYSSAILARLAGEVVTPEAGGWAEKARRAVWAELGLRNISPVGRGSGYEHDFYDLIVINGSVRAVPPALAAMLRDGGRLVAVVRPAGAPLGVLTLAEKGAGPHLAVRGLYDAVTPYLSDFAPEPDFVF